MPLLFSQRRKVSQINSLVQYNKMLMFNFIVLKFTNILKSIKLSFTKQILLINKQFYIQINLLIFFYMKYQMADTEINPC